MGRNEVKLERALTHYFLQNLIVERFGRNEVKLERALTHTSRLNGIPLPRRNEVKLERALTHSIMESIEERTGVEMK